MSSIVRWARRQRDKRGWERVEVVFWCCALITLGFLLLAWAAR